MTHICYISGLSPATKGGRKRIFNQNQWVGHFAMGNPNCFHQVIMDDSCFAFSCSLQRQRAGKETCFCRIGHFATFSSKSMVLCCSVWEVPMVCIKALWRTRVLHFRPLRRLLVENGKVQKPCNAIRNTTLVSLKDSPPSIF